MLTETFENIYMEKCVKIQKIISWNILWPNRIFRLLRFKAAMGWRWRDLPMNLSYLLAKSFIARPTPDFWLKTLDRINQLKDSSKLFFKMSNCDIWIKSDMQNKENYSSLLFWIVMSWSHNYYNYFISTFYFTIKIIYNIFFTSTQGISWASAKSLSLEIRLNFSSTETRKTLAPFWKCTGICLLKWKDLNPNPFSFSEDLNEDQIGLLMSWFARDN